MISLYEPRGGGVEMQRPGLGDLAGRGAACWLTPDLRLCSGTTLGLNYPQGYPQVNTVDLGSDASTAPVSSPTGLRQALRTGNPRWRAPDTRDHGPPPSSAQRTGRERDKGQAETPERSGQRQAPSSRHARTMNLLPGWARRAGHNRPPAARSGSGIEIPFRILRHRESSPKGTGDG